MSTWPRRAFRGRGGGDELDVTGGRVRAGQTSRGRIRTGLVVYAWLSTELGSLGKQVDVQYLRERHPATVAADSLFAPEMLRMRS
jgi:hypothetical protein